ncbi:Maf family nucleotide pyrophosphatase [Aestuariirhabdus sp. Z084]|nr:nucleoside triphosphate pyrophosphatase [Aestuariirhabdus haliotis]MCL6414797.1 Maf family nucleotide pyrophosphatase [Aestuariirhabdus haliotis]MCL6418729.1 Maf family nucleotide pyrophosphatase [Aestuariirhabdus haliotis]
MTLSPPPIILASSSRYRRQLLDQLGLKYDWAAPDIDESPLPTETPDALAIRLAKEKAVALQEQFPRHLLIASDQVAVNSGRMMGKSGSRERAIEQLTSCSGNSVEFLTSLCVLNTLSGREHISLSRYRVQFRALTANQIENYIDRDQPFDCAGSFKVEGLGAALFLSHEGEDPSSLIGLPLISLCTALLDEGIDPLVR